MKFFKLILLLFSISSAFSQNSIALKNLEAGPGDETEIVVSLENIDDVSGFQFTLKLPSNLIVKEKEVSFVDRNTNHVIYPKAKGNGEYLFVCFSATNDVFTGNSGDLMVLPIELPLSYTPSETYDMLLQDVVLSSSTGLDIGANHQNGVLTITEGKHPDLIPETISFQNSEIVPQESFSLNWAVKNIGELGAIGGWKEQVYLSSQNSSQDYLIGTQTFSGDVLVNQTVDRTGVFTIPPIIGFDGDVKIKIVLLPFASVKETEALKLNNTTISDTNANLSKKIIFTINKSEIVKNSGDKIRVNLSRSGAISTSEEFTITADDNQFLELPLTLQLDENQFSNIAYIDLKPTAEYTGDKAITLTASGGTYTSETKPVTIIEDKEINLVISTPPDYDTVIGSEILFTLNASYSNPEDTTISIRSDNSRRMQLPETVVLKADETTLTFEGTIIDPGTVEKRETILIYASATDYVTASKAIEMGSVNIPNFEFVLEPNTVSEGDGINATFASLKRTSQIDKEVILTLSSDQNDRLILPNDVSFEAGEVEKRFNIGTIDNATVEGDKTITVSSLIKFSECNCTDETDQTTVTSQQFTVIDNDGLAILLSVSPSTIKAGASNNFLTITRNTADPDILKDPLEVTLSNNLPTVINLPTSATIPANENKITISYDTRIDTTLEGDQNVRIEANATDYNVGFAWVLVTDQNLPDVIVSDIQLPSQVEAGTKVTIKTVITNQGYADFEYGAILQYYLSPNNSISGINPFNETILPQGVNAGATYEFNEDVQLPVQSGELNLIIDVNAANAITELSTSNNQNFKAVEFLPAYTVTVSSDKDVYVPGEKVIISGEAKALDGSLVTTSDVEITITNTDFSRVFTSKTNDDGQFVYEFEPLESEQGTYTIKAAYPGADVAAQETFTILGFEIVNKPKYIKWEPFVGFPLGKEFILKNNTSVRLTGVQINLSPDAGFTLEQSPIIIEAGEQVALNFTINATEVSIENSYLEVPITITSNEGAELKELIYYYSKTKQANLVSDPISINTTMAKETRRFYEFVVKNTGDVDANNVEVLLPALPWLKLISPKIIEVIKAENEAKIVLELAPTPTEQVNIPISGTFVLKGDNFNGLTVPFRIETVSDAMGKIVVDATDEYTYNTASVPHLEGAKVLIKHPYTGAVVAEGITDVNGLFEIPSIKEGFYVVDVSAEKHNPYQKNILVDPSKTTFVNAFMQYRAVTYSWEVVPTEVEDEYDITLVTVFETNVPKPVVVMKLDNPNLDLEEGKSRLINLTITNHGLVAASNVKLTASEIEGYEMKPLITSMDRLLAKTTVVVPILLKRLTKRAGELSGGCSQGSVDFEGSYPCNGPQKLNATAGVYGKECDGPTGGPGGLGGGGLGFPGGGGDSDPLPPSGGPYTPTEFPDFCDPCLRKTFTTILRCNPYTAGIEGAICVIDVFTSTSFLDLIDNLIDCKKKATRKIRCIKDIIEAIVTCISGDDDDNLLDQLMNMRNDKWDPLREDLEKIDAAQDATFSKIDEYLKNEALRESEEFIVFLEEIASNLDLERAFTANDIAILKLNLANTSISEDYINNFTQRWNTTIIAWDLGIFSPNTQYPDIVDKVKIKEYQNIMDQLVVYTTNRGFISVNEMYSNVFKEIEEFQEEKEDEDASVCATVTIEFPQRLTMTREAFEGTLSINNSSEKSIKEIKLDLIVKNELGENKTELFQINKDAFLSGTGVVDPDSKGSGVAIFIPSKVAAPEVAQSYSFGGILSYFDEEQGETVSITLNPVTLEVNPSPDLILDYFLQRDIIGDDALTEDIVEPSIPAELSLMITNDGYGEARNLKVESMQPRIVENEKGLAIDFEMIGSNFNNEPTQLGLLDVDFGTIDPKTSAIGQWYFTSSLLGKFVKYDIQVNHKSNYSAKNISLIKEANIHELIKSVKAYQDGNDDIMDFLVNDSADSKDTPDRLFYSNGTSEEVISAETVESSNAISGANLTTKVTIKPFTTGWNYGYIVDPGNKQYRLTKVVRDTDGVEMPLANFWQTSVTLRDGLNPKYENNLHVLDKISGITIYTLFYIPKNTNTPTIIAIEGVPENESTATPVDLLTVKFNKEIDVNSFTTNAIKIIHQGVELNNDDILIGKIDATTYSLTLKELTKLSGYYEVTVSSLDIKDVLGNSGENAKRVTWVQFLNELGILKFESDQVKKQAINTITVTFNKEIRSEEFTNNNITINKNPINSDVTITKLDDFNYSISGINTYNQENRNYNLEVDLPLITAVDGSKGLSKQSYSWIVDNNLPKIVTITPRSQGGINSQNITEIDIELNKKLANDIEASAITFSKNGQQLSIPITVQKNNDFEYTIFGLGSYTEDNGNYKISIDQTTLVDENDNVGVGVAESLWTVKLNALIGLNNVTIVPDIGISSNDNITSGNNIELVYETLEDNLTVEVYELLATSEVLSYENIRDTKGEYRIPLQGKVGSKRFKVIAYDDNGNRSEPEVVSIYIDFADIVVDINPIKEIEDGSCYDFDYVEVSFSEEIVDSSFTIEAITLKTSGIEIPKNTITITKMNALTYRLENILYEDDGLIDLEIDKTKIIKKISGLVGLNSETKALGVPNRYEATIDGEDRALINQAYTYTATVDLKKYDWIIINGEIITSEDNTVTVKWNKLGQHSLLLRYQTPLECTATTIIRVEVYDETLSNDNTTSEIKMNISPVPNNGEFSIHTSKPLSNCNIDIFNLHGQLLYNEENVNFNENKKSINVKNISSGIYVLVLTHQGYKFDFKFVIK